MTITRDAKRPYSIPSENKQKQNKIIYTQAIKTVWKKSVLEIELI